VKIARFSVYRPIFTIMVTLIVILLGGIALQRLPIDLMPDVSNPTISIQTSYENAGPQEVEELITRPIERAVSAVPGVEEVTSVSSEGQSSVRITFVWGTDLDAAANDLRDRLDRVVGQLPDDAERPMLLKFDLASFPVLIMGAYSDLDPVQMRELIEDQIRYRIERVPGVASLNVWGGLEREIHVNLSFAKLKALELSLENVLARIRSANVNIPAGAIERGNDEVTIRTPGEFTTLTELAETVIGERDGVPILLREVAQIDDNWRKVTRLVRVNGKPGLRLAVQKQSGTNTVEVAERLRAELDRIAVDYPQMPIVPIIDSSQYIRRSISNISNSALYGGLLAVAVLLFFLRSVRSTVVIATAIPISIVATFALVYFCGYTLNLMTLGGLALGVGMLVDNAIVVLENIYRLHEEEHRPPIEAATHGAEEVTAAIIASTLTTVVVFLPVVFMRGVSGVMFQQMAVVVTFSLLCSLVVAVTLVPMLASRIMKPKTVEEQVRHGYGARVFAASGRLFTWLEDHYRDLLALSLRHRVLVLTATALVLGGSVALMPLIGVELMPATDEGEVRVDADLAVGTRLGVSERTMVQIEEIVRREVPEADNLVTSIGPSRWGRGGSSSGEIRVSLVPAHERQRSSEEVAAALRPHLAKLPGVSVRTRAGQGLNFMRMGGGDKLEVEVRGHDLATSEALARQVKAIMLDVEGITDVTISRESGSPEEVIRVDRRKAADLGVTVQQVAELLETALSGTRASDFRSSGNEYRILVKLANAEQTPLDELLDLTLTNNRGEPVVLRNLVTSRAERGPTLIERKNQERVVMVSANYADRDLGSIVTELQERLHEVPVPQDFSLLFGGDYEEQQKAFKELLLGMVLALVLVYMVMACLYESLRDPFVVMFSVPLAAIGVFLTLFLTRTTFNIQSYIGIIMLAGIVVNNAILLVDHTNLLRRRDGMALFEAIAEAGRRRLRPILMTALTTILGLLPLALGMGEGGEAQAPLARAVIGGLTSSTLITLLVVPVIYSLFERGTHHHAPTA
jgi:HAE1 family hydrophobic/amphiphilic exporter-1